MGVGNGNADCKRHRLVRRGLSAAALGSLVAGLTLASPALAFDCSKAYLAVDYVICAEPALIAAVDRLQGTWDVIKGKLDEASRKALVTEQKQWISDYAARCGVPGRGRPSEDAIERAKTCVAGELGQRRAYLASLAPSAPASAPPASVPSEPPRAAVASPPPSAPAARPTSDPDLEETYRYLFDPAKHVTIDVGPATLKIVGKPPRQPDVTGQGWVILLSGRIDPEADKRFGWCMAAYNVPNGSEVNLHSPGGNVRAGMALGREFRRREVTTSVARETPGRFKTAPGGCYSACSLAYLGGKFRVLDAGAEYGVHRFSFSMSTVADADVAQVLSGHLIDYLKEMDIDSELYSMMSQAGSDEMLVLPKPELERLRVVNNGILNASWTVESIEAGLYVKGQQETFRGVSKAIFMCGEKGQIIYKPMFTGGVPPGLLGGASPRRLLINDQAIDLAPYEVEKVWRDKAYVTGVYVLPRNLVSAILEAKRIGFAVLAPNPDMFYGFTMDVTDGRRKLVGFVANCR